MRTEHPITCLSLVFVVLAAALISACGSFDDPQIVYDLRYIGARTEPPEVLIDPEAMVEDVLDLPPVEVCAWVADPGESRELSFRMIACPPTDSERCEDAELFELLGRGRVDDPEEADAPVQICATMSPTPTLFEIVQASVSADALAGFGAIDVQVGIAVWPAELEVEDAIFASKKARFGATIPVERVANKNPRIDRFIVSRSPESGRGQEFELPLGRCADIDNPPIVAPGEVLQVLPVEPEGVREEYVVPTFDGGSRTFTELMSYRWMTSHGSWSQGQTGGDRDLSGELPPIFNRWRAPRNLERIGEGLDVSWYIVQRDGRNGQAWAESCVRVVP